MFRRSTGRRRAKPNSGRNTKLHEYMYKDDDMAAIDFWLQQPVVNFRSDKAWNALLTHLKDTRKKNMTKQNLQNHWMKIIDPNLNKECGTACPDREQLGWEESATVEQKLEVLGKRFERIRVERREKIGTLLLADERRKSLTKFEDDTVVFVPTAALHDSKLNIKKPVAAIKCTKSWHKYIRSTNVNVCESVHQRRKWGQDTETFDASESFKRQKLITKVQDNTDVGLQGTMISGEVNLKLPGDNTYPYAVNFMGGLPLKFSSGAPGAESVDVEGFTLPDPCFTGKTFHVLKSPGNFIDCSSASIHEYLILIYGGNVLDKISEVTDSTIVITSQDQACNLKMLQTMRGHKYTPDIIYEWIEKGISAVLTDFDQYMYHRNNSFHPSTLTDWADNSIGRRTLTEHQKQATFYNEVQKDILSRNFQSVIPKKCLDIRENRTDLKNPAIYDKQTTPCSPEEAKMPYPDKVLQLRTGSNEPFALIHGPAHKTGSTIGGTMDMNDTDYTLHFEEPTLSEFSSNMHEKHEEIQQIICQTSVRTKYLMIKPLRLFSVNGRNQPIPTNMQQANVNSIKPQALSQTTSQEDYLTSFGTEGILPSTNKSGCEKLKSVNISTNTPGISLQENKTKVDGSIHSSNPITFVANAETGSKTYRELEPCESGETKQQERPRMLALLFELAPDMPMSIKAFCPLVEEKYRERYNMKPTKEVWHLIRKMKSLEEEFRKVKDVFGLQDYMLDNLRQTIKAPKQSPSFT